MDKNKKILVLLDAHAILHRAFHALPNFISPKGEPTGALYGFTAFLLKVIRELKPDYIVACYDLPELTFRKVAYEGYKAKRPKMDDILATQINRSRDILNSFKIPIYDSSGFEADDILGTIVENLKTKKLELKIIIASGDLDTLQLVDNDNVVVYTLSKGIKEAVIYNEKSVIERFGFTPKLLPDFKGLKGDPSDNIIGVPGIGDKSASELIKKFGLIEDMYKELKKNKGNFIKTGIKERIVKLLEENEEEALFSKTLAEIRRDAPIKFSLEQSAWKESFDIEKIKSLFNEFGFRSLIDRLTEKNNLPVVKEENDLFKKFNNQVPEKLFKEVEAPLFGILSEMEQEGIKIDVDYLKELSKEYHKELKKLEKKIWTLTGQEFNINSPKQLAEILFDKLELKVKNLRKTNAGSRSTNIFELIKLKNAHPVINEIISYREFAKLISTYIDALPKMVDKNNRLHTHFDQAGTTTGRISSKDPNLQNIPIRTEIGKKIRKAFIVGKGNKLVSFDYSQIELRVAAILSKDTKMTEIFKRGEDIHNAVASEVFNVDIKEITSEMRRRAKVINFGIIYGMGINALKVNLNCSREEAQIFYDEYFKDFKGMADYVNSIKEIAREKGYTETLFGRKRYFPEINSPLEYIRKEAERMAINAPIQGTAADFIKIAMVRIDKELRDKKLKEKVKMLLQIHDELLFEIDEGLTKEVLPVIIKIMEGVYKDSVPIKINVSTGNNWSDMVEYNNGK